MLTGKDCRRIKHSELARSFARVCFVVQNASVFWNGEVAEWLKATDCKSVLFGVRWFESSPLHHIFLQVFAFVGFVLVMDI